MISNFLISFNYSMKIYNTIEKENAEIENGLIWIKYIKKRTALTLCMTVTISIMMNLEFSIF